MTKRFTLLGLAFMAICCQLGFSQANADFTINQGNSICAGECITITNNSTSAVNITDYSWTILGTPTPMIPSPNGENPDTICFNDVGTFLIELRIEDQNGNISNANVQLEVISCPGSLAAGFTTKSTVCLDECVVMRDTSVGMPGTWLWTFDPPNSVSPTFSTDQNPEICFVSTNGGDPITVSLTVRNQDGTKFSKTTKQIVVVENPTVTAVKDTIVELGNPVLLDADAVGASRYSWEPSGTVVRPNLRNSFAYPVETTDYIIRAEDGNGCFAEDTVKVYLNFLPNIGVPTAFSPNGDGQNDLLVVKGLGLTKCIFKVYNRYGIQIFESTEQKNGWDGNYRGKMQDPGVFHWTLEYEFNTGNFGILSGNTTLVR